jgi:hypothetical protein
MVAGKLDGRARERNHAMKNERACGQSGEDDVSDTDGGSPDGRNVDRVSVAYEWDHAAAGCGKPDDAAG